MSGFARFFKSERESDTKLVLLLPSKVNLATSCCSEATSVSNNTLVDKIVPDGVCECSAGPSQDDKDQDTIICIPAHRIVLIAKSDYFSSRLGTDVGEQPTQSISEHADSLGEIAAMEAVVEFMYTEQLPLFCTQDVEPARDFGGEKLPLLQRLLLTLTIADQWQVSTLLAACCSAICERPTADMTWEDCHAVFDLPAGLLEQPHVACVSTHATTAAIALACTAQTNLDGPTLSDQLCKLPISLRLALLKSCKLSFTAMLVLLSSDEQVADSEDALAMHLRSYYGSVAGKACSVSERKQLKDQLRYQHMSHSFVGLKVSSSHELGLNIHELSQLVYLRGLNGFETIPLQCQQPKVAAAWYKPARKQDHLPTDSLELKLNISESALSEHLKAVMVLRAGWSGADGARPSKLRGDILEFGGISWQMELSSNNVAEPLWLGVRTLRATTGNLDSAASHSAGIHVNITYRLDTAPSITAHIESAWVNGEGWGYNGFVKRFGDASGDPTDISWWADYIRDGYVHFSATVQVL